MDNDFLVFLGDKFNLRRGEERRQFLFFIRDRPEEAIVFVKHVLFAWKMEYSTMNYRVTTSDLELETDPPVIVEYLKKRFAEEISALPITAAAPIPV